MYTFVSNAEHAKIDGRRKKVKIISIQVISEHVPLIHILFLETRKTKLQSNLEADIVCVALQFLRVISVRYIRNYDGYKLYV